GRATRGADSDAIRGPSWSGPWSWRLSPWRLFRPRDHRAGHGAAQVPEACEPSATRLARTFLDHANAPRTELIMTIDVGGEFSPDAGGPACRENLKILKPGDHRTTLLPRTR